MQLRSDAVRCGTARAPHRSLLKADGITDEEMERPLVAVFNSRNDIIPGHNNLDKIAEAVKAGIYMAGGVPFLETREKNHFVRVDAHEWQLAIDQLNKGDVQ